MKINLSEIIAVFIVTLIASGFSHAGILQDQKGVGWVSKRDLTSAQFSQNFDDYKKQGYLMIDVDAYPYGKETRYSMVWRKNPDGRAWAEHRDMSSDVYHEKWQEYKERGYRPLDVEQYEVGSNSSRWAGIWVQNVEGIDWFSHRNLTSEEHATLFEEHKKRGYHIVDIEAYETSKGMRYASIWYYNSSGVKWAQLRDMTRDEYQAEVDEKSKDGLRVVDFESYQTPWGQRYAAIWETKAGYAWQVRSNRTQQQFINLWYQYADEGYRLVDFERNETDSGPRYAGIWAENASRFSYSKKDLLNNLITSYSSVNNLPGISVVIIENGNTLYRRGFDFADVANNKTAHSKTVYNTASVAKVIGGTLAAKLEDEGELNDGTAFDLDLSNTTASYIVGLPGHHTHTVEQLLSHLSCVAHYTTDPAIANQNTHYTNATDAMLSIWNTGLIDDCNPGSSWNYSTPAFVFAGAVLESVTGKTVNELLDEELIGPYGLSSMRVQYAEASLPANSLRAVPYTTQDAVHTPDTTDFVDPPHPVNNPNVATTYSDNSWKVLSGGIESNTYDLARFAWKVLNADIVSADARDNRLWTRVNPSFSHGLGWSITAASSGENVAEWNGSWTGARSFLRAYTDDGLVIAIMTNRTTHRSDLNQDVVDLANSLGNVVLN